MAKSLVISNEAIENRIKKLIEKRNEMINVLDDTHVKLQRGNRKTGANC